MSGEHTHPDLFDVTAGLRADLLAMASRLSRLTAQVVALEAAADPRGAYVQMKVETRQVIPLNTWTTIDLGTVDAVVPPIGSNDWWVQVHLDLATATCPRNDLRYVKGRWARKLPAGDDTHGTDTKAISADIPKDSWQGAFSTDMKGLAGVPVTFEVYVGSVTSRGTVVSPMRLYTVDDETT